MSEVWARRSDDQLGPQPATVCSRETAQRPQFTPILCWSLIGEGKDERIWQWMREEVYAASHAEDGSPMPAAKQCLGWMAGLMAYLGGTQVDWVANGAADSAIRVLLRAITVSKREGKFWCIGGGALRTAVAKMLMEESCPPCDPHLYD